MPTARRNAHFIADPFVPLVDWICTAASLLIAGIRNPTRVLVRIWPHIGTLVSFVAFVAWNGSVVLGLLRPRFA